MLEVASGLQELFKDTGQGSSFSLRSVAMLRAICVMVYELAHHNHTVAKDSPPSLNQYNPYRIFLCLLLLFACIAILLPRSHPRLQLDKRGGKLLTRGSEVYWVMRLWSRLLMVGYMSKRSDDGSS